MYLMSLIRRVSFARTPGVHPRLPAFGWLIVLTLAIAPAAPASDSVALPAARPERGSAELVDLRSLRGKIVVLDFFAHWCAPCLRATQLIEDEVRQPYARSGGTRNGHPVEVIAVNLEASQPQRTERFLERTRPHRVVDDFGGVWLAAFGGKALPYVVVLDGTRADAAGGGWKVLSTSAGLESVGALVATIEAVDGLQRDDSGSRDRPEVPISRDRATERRLETSFERLWADDIAVSQASLQARTRWQGTEWALSFATTRYRLDYQPVSFDLAGAAVTREEINTALQLNAKRSLSDRWTLLAGGGGYRGFTHFRTLWLDEYFNQQYGRFSSSSGIPGLDRYRPAAPRGASLTTGARWEYLPGSGFVQASVSWLTDRVSPGYEIDFEGLRRGAETLVTRSAALSFENVLSPRLRTLVELRAAETSERAPRMGGEVSVNLALSERGVLRFQAGGSREGAEFRARYAGVTLEWELDRGWAVFADGRFYKDSGEIENALLFTSAAPGVVQRQAGLGLRWAGERSSLRLAVAPMRTRYGDVGTQVDFFRNLYRSRDWSWVQAAAQFSF